MLKKLFFSTLILTAAVCFPSTETLGQDHSGDHPEEHAGDVDESLLKEEAEEQPFDPAIMIMHHVQDAHGFHIYGAGENSVTLPLPVILWTENGLVTFMSSEFHHDTHGHEVVERKGMQFVNYHDDIHMLGPNGELDFDEEGHPTDPMPLDFSITKNVFTLFMAAVILCLIFMGTARHYKNGRQVPRGLSSFMEPLVLFVRDDIARPNIGPRYEKYMPFLLTLFFLIWFGNLIGLIPFFPFSANLTGNISFTLALAAITLIVVNASGSKHYWQHLFAPPTHWALWPIMIPIELIGVFTKPFALMIRLFANITAGHIIILSLISLIFFFQNVAIAGVSVPFALFISVLELLVAALQAYIFTMLAALFIGQARHDDHV